MRKKSNSNTIVLAGIFAALVLFLVGASLVIKLLGIVAQSNFDGRHRFTVLVSDVEGNSVFVSVDPMNATSSRLAVSGASRRDLKALLPIAIDGEVVLSTEIDPKSQASSIVREVLVKKNNVRDKVTGVDLVRMYWALKTAEPGKKYEEEITFNEAEEVAELFSELFSDFEIEEEDKTVAIENGSSVSGAGGRMERVLSVMGVNVVSVETAVMATPSSYIKFFESESYTSRRLERLLGYPATSTEQVSFSDISIIIGEDGLNNFVFEE